MRDVLRAALALPLLLPAIPAAAEPAPQVTVELNTKEEAADRCRMTFVTENKSGAAIETLKLDLVVFDQGQRMSRRLVIEMAPLPTGKTSVRTYAIDTACADIRSILVNDVSACAPAKPEDCLSGLTLSSRIDGMRFFK